MIRKYTCIICPNGCDIEVNIDKDKIKSIKGSSCKKGDEYVRQEIFDPKRNISSSIKIEDGNLPLVSVRLSNPIPKEMIFDVMKLIKNVTLKAPVNIGDVVISNILNTGSNLIITKNVERKII